jgi:transcriptional regulator with XRE-family HTH domain
VILGERIRRYRAVRNLTQTELALKTGVTKLTISRIENGVKYPHPATIRKIAEALEVPAAELIDADEAIERRKKAAA